LFLALLSAIAVLVGGVFAERSPNKTVTIGGGRPAGGYGPPPGGPAGYAPPPQGPGGFAQPPAGPGAQATTAQPVPAMQPPPPAAPAQPAGPPPPPPGGTPDWYPDPYGQKRLRYFDGNQWTDHIAD
jgi:hypothetical protein